MPRLRRSALVNPSEVLFPAANPFHIRQILGASGGPFVPQQQFLADDPNRQAVEIGLNFGFPRFFEGNRRDGRRFPSKKRGKPKFKPISTACRFGSSARNCCCGTNGPPDAPRIWRMWNGLAAGNRTSDGFTSAERRRRGIFVAVSYTHLRAHE